MADTLELYDRLSRTYRTAFRVEDIAESLDGILRVSSTFQEVRQTFSRR